MYTDNNILMRRGPYSIIAMVGFRPYPIQITIMLIILLTLGHMHTPAINIGIRVVI